MIALADAWAPRAGAAPARGDGGGGGGDGGGSAEMLESLDLARNRVAAPARRLPTEVSDDVSRMDCLSLNGQ